MSGTVVGARGGRTEREGHDDDEERGESAPAVGGDGLHQRAVTRPAGEGCAVNDIGVATVRAAMADERPWAGRRLHLIGLGGAGMSGYARVATQLGAAVSGSDRVDSAGLRALAALGVEVHVGHAAANVPAAEGVEVVHSTAIPLDNPERAAARERGLPDLPRADLLAQLSALKRTIRPRRRR